MNSGKSWLLAINKTKRHKENKDAVIIVLISIAAAAIATFMSIRY
jgi:hypothetical protein